MNNFNPAIHFIMRLLACGVWLSVGLHKSFNSDFHIAGLEAHGITILPGVLLGLFILLEIGGSILVLMNKYVWAVCLGWICFIIPASFLYHTVWVGEYAAGNYTGAPFYDMANFVKNVSIFGGIIALMFLDPNKPAWLNKIMHGQADVSTA